MLETISQRLVGTRTGRVLENLADYIPRWWISFCRFAIALIVACGLSFWAGLNTGRDQQREVLAIVSTRVAAERGYFTSGEVAIREGVSQRSITLWCNQDRIPGATKTRGGRWRIPLNYSVRPSDAE